MRVDLSMIGGVDCGVDAHECSEHCSDTPVGCLQLEWTLSKLNFVMYNVSSAISAFYNNASFKSGLLKVLTPKFFSRHRQALKHLNEKFPFLSIISIFVGFPPKQTVFRVNNFSNCPFALSRSHISSPLLVVPGMEISLVLNFVQVLSVSSSKIQLHWFNDLFHLCFRQLISNLNALNYIHSIAPPSKEPKSKIRRGRVEKLTQLMIRRHADCMLSRERWSCQVMSKGGVGDKLRL